MKDPNEFITSLAMAVDWEMAFHAMEHHPERYRDDGLKEVVDVEAMDRDMLDLILRTRHKLQEGSPEWTAVNTMYEFTKKYGMASVPQSSPAQAAGGGRRRRRRRRGK